MNETPAVADDHDTPRLYEIASRDTLMTDGPTGLAA